MANWGDIDLNDSISEDESEHSDNDGGWDAGDDNDGLVDNWQSAPSPEEIEQEKKKKEEQEQREKEELIEAQKKRKAEIKEKKRKEKLLLEQDFDSADDFFDVAATNEKKQRADLQAALDALGGLEDTTDPSKIDIGLYKPNSVEHFKMYEEAIILKINSMFPPLKNEDKKKKDTQDNAKVQLIEYLITALADSYKSAFIHELDKKMLEFYNSKLNATKDKHKQKGKSKAYMSVKRDDFDDADDDFM